MSFNSKNIHIVKAGFPYKCISVFIDAYQIMLRENNYNTSWKENKITKVLVKYYKNSHYCKNGDWILLVSIILMIIRKMIQILIKHLVLILEYQSGRTKNRLNSSSKLKIFVNLIG
ncbi:MAG: hypothetical protein HC831_15350 [Chloroflexia bacterium]|nr:hypothetical protein [Chloroflexia bacterium]